jgi:iron complex outermembrane receptor protein
MVGPFSAFVTYVHDERRGDTRNLGAGTVLDRTDPFWNIGKQTSPKWLRSKNGESIFAAVKFEPSDAFSVTYKFDWGSQHSTPEVRAVTALNSANPAAALLNVLLATQTPGGGAYGATGLNPSDRRPKEFNNAWTTRAMLKTQGHNLTMVWDATDNLSIKNIFAYRKAKSYGLTTIVGLDGLEITAATAAVANAFFPFGIFTFGANATVGSLYSVYGGNNAGKNHQYSNELQLNYSNDRLNVTAGLLWYDSYEDFGLPGYNGNIAFQALPLSNEVPLGNVAQQFSKTTSIAAYVQAEYELTDQLSVVAGGRVTRDKKHGNLEVGGTFVGPRTSGSIVGTTNNPFRFKKTKPTFSIGLNYEPNADILLYGKYSTAFLSGGAVGVLTFAPETVSSFEAGIKSDWLDRKLRVNLTGWYAKYKHSQAAQSGSTVGQPQLSVVVVDNGPLKAWGLEFETVVKPAEGLTISGNLGYTHHKLTDPFFLFEDVLLQDYKHGGIPTLVGNVNAQYETPPLFGDASLLFRIDANYQSKFRAISDDNIDVPGSPTYVAEFAPYEFNPQRWIVNTRMALRDVEIGGASAEVGLWSRNLFNVKKPMFPFPFGTILLTNSYQEARTWGVDVIVKFGSHR